MKIGRGSKIYETAKIVTEDNEIEIGENCFIGDFAFVAVKKLVMMDGAEIAPHAIISGGGQAILGKYSVVDFGAHLVTGTDTPSARYMCGAAPPEKRRIVRGSITLGEGSYVGSGAIICVSKKCSNIKIGDYAVIGALSYIDDNVSPYTIIHPCQEKQVTERRIINDV